MPSIDDHIPVINFSLPIIGHGNRSLKPTANMTRTQKMTFYIRFGFPVAVMIVVLLVNFFYLDSQRLRRDVNLLNVLFHDVQESNFRESRLGSNLLGENREEYHNTNTTVSFEGRKTGRFTLASNMSEVRHIAFLKVHKCASSTTLNILYRFGFKRNLNFVLPIRGNYLEFSSKRGSITEIPPPFKSDYDILCNHVIHFNKYNFARYLPSDTTYIAIVREPFQRMQSAFNYYRNILRFPFLKRILGNDPFQTYLSKINYFETQWDDHSVTNNKMARDFGFPLSDFRNVTKFKSYLKEIDKIFDFVMVRELFEESLVLVRRLLNWSMKEIVFRIQNAHVYEPLSVENNTHRTGPFLALDYILYDHFLLKLKERINSEGQGFLDEVSYFRSINRETSLFCSSKDRTNKLVFSATTWHEDFEISKQDCAFMNKSELQFLSLVRNSQIEKLKRFGANVTKFIE